MAEGTRNGRSSDEDQLARLWAEYGRRRALETRNQLIEHHLPFCRRIAAWLYAQRGVVEAEFGDYLQLATLGMIEALDRFEPERGVPFEAFARLRVRGAVLNGLASMSEKYQQLSLRKRLRREELESLKSKDGEEKHSRRQVDAFSRLAGVAISLALGQLLEGSRMLHIEGHTDSYRQEFYDSLEEKRLRETLVCLVEALPERERQVVELHYFQSLEFKDIAALFGVSRGRISQVHRNALQLLKEAYGMTARLDASF
jgi:RNA polymerase sigma factor FliA